MAPHAFDINLDLSNRLAFHSAKQTHREGDEDFARRLEFLANTCNYDQKILSILIRDRFIAGLFSKKKQERLLRNPTTLSLKEAIGQLQESEATDENAVTIVEEVVTLDEAAKAKVVADEISAVRQRVFNLRKIGVQSKDLPSEKKSQSPTAEGANPKRVERTDDMDPLFSNYNDPDSNMEPIDLDDVSHGDDSSDEETTDEEGKGDAVTFVKEVVTIDEDHAKSTGGWSATSKLQRLSNPRKIAVRRIVSKEADIRDQVPQKRMSLRRNPKRVEHGDDWELLNKEGSDHENGDDAEKEDQQKHEDSGDSSKEHPVVISLMKSKAEEKTLKKDQEPKPSSLAHGHGTRSRRSQEKGPVAKEKKVVEVAREYRAYVRLEKIDEVRAKRTSGSRENQEVASKDQILQSTRRSSRKTRGSSRRALDEIDYDPFDAIFQPRTTDLSAEGDKVSNKKVIEDAAPKRTSPSSAKLVKSAPKESGSKESCCEEIVTKYTKEADEEVTSPNSPLDMKFESETEEDPFEASEKEDGESTRQSPRKGTRRNKDWKAILDEHDDDPSSDFELPGVNESSDDEGLVSDHETVVSVAPKRTAPSSATVINSANKSLVLKGVSDKAGKKDGKESNTNANSPFTHLDLKNESFKVTLDFMDPKKRYQCPACPLRGLERRLFLVHLRSFHKPEFETLFKESEKFKCRFCDNTVCHPLVLARHVEDNHEEEAEKDPPKCQQCDNLQFSNENDLAIHVRTKHVDKGFQTNSIYLCDFCNFCCFFFYDLETHIRANHNEMVAKLSVPCDVCNERFTCSSRLAFHLRQNHPEQFKIEKKRKAPKIPKERPPKVSKKFEKYKCELCDAKFSTKATMEDHQKQIHLDELQNLRLQHKANTLALAQEAIKVRDDIVLIDLETLDMGSYVQLKNSMLFCCNVHYDDLPVLRDHVADAHKATIGRNGKNFALKMTEEVPEGLPEGVRIFEPHKTICTLCNKEFRDEKCVTLHNVKFHADLIPARDKVKCKFCDRVFLGSYDRARHVRQDHEDLLIYNCDVEGCEAKFFSKPGVRNHKKIAHQELTFVALPVMPSSFPCEFCDEYFLSENVMHTHLSEYHPEEVKNFQHFCEECGMSFSTAGGLGTHQTWKHPKEKKKKRSKIPGENCTFLYEDLARFPCEYCDQAFFLENKLVQHMQEHHPFAKREVEYSCEICDEKFPTESSLSTHKSMVHKVETAETRKKKVKDQDRAPEGHKFKCQFCPKSFSFRRDCRIHLRKKHIHLISKDPKPCSECGESFFTSESLALHLRRKHKIVSDSTMTTGAKKLCTMCGKEFVNLTWHIKNRHTEKTIKCDQCPKKFSTQQAKRHHVIGCHYEQVSSLYKPRNTAKTCNLCGFVAAGPSKLTAHMKNNHGYDYSVDCDVCGKKYSSHALMKMHKDTIHLGLRPHQCNECEESFKHSNTLETHVNRVHRKIKFPCDQCDVVLASLASLRMHMRRRHKKTSLGHLWKYRAKIEPQKQEN